MQHIIEIGNIRAVRSAIIALPPFFFGDDDTGLTIFFELFANGGFVEHHGRFKARQIFRVDLLE